MVALTSSIVTAVVDATAATARLDQALSSSASLAAWTEQMVIEEACAGQAIEGNLITKLDLTLALENTPNALGQGDMLSARRHVRNLTTLLRQTNKPDWGLKPLYRIMSRVKVIGGAPNAAPSDAFILYDYDLKTDDIISQWLTCSEERRAYPGLLAIAASLFDWLRVEPFSYTDKHRVMLLGETLSSASASALLSDGNGFSTGVYLGAGIDLFRIASRISNGRSSSVTASPYDGPGIPNSSENS